MDAIEPDIHKHVWVPFQYMAFASETTPARRWTTIQCQVCHVRKDRNPKEVYGKGNLLDYKNGRLK